MVELNAVRASGRLSVAGTGIPTESIAERFDAGESVEALCVDYGLGSEQVEAAIRWRNRALDSAAA